MLFFRYLLERRRVIAASLLLGAGAWYLFRLYGLPQSPLLYCFLLIATVGWGLFGLPDFVSFYRRLRQAQALRRAAPHLTEPVDAGGRSQPLGDRLMAETVEELRQRIAGLETQLAGRQEELLEYFTLWAHQIKTPLAAMELLVQTGQTGPQANEALRQELFQTERYVELVLGYLRIYSMSADLRLTLCPVRPIAARAAKRFATPFIYKGLTLDLGDFENQVVTDEKWLQFVLEQLISNAVKYTPSGKVSIDMDGEDVLTVSDQGVGIDPADLPRIFERGFTGRNGRQQQASTGLGLYLTRRVLDKLGNQVQVLSQPGQGTQVRLYLGRGAPPRD